MKIKDFVVGQSIEATLVVRSAVARETKAKKPYLTVEFFDGQDIIPANYWDWTSGNIPETNAILDVSAAVTEWNGTKQLTIKSMVTNQTAKLEDFMPTSGIDIERTHDAALILMNEVSDETLRTIAVGILEELKHLWLTVPGAKSVHHNFVGGTLVHSYDVAVLAKAIAENTKGANVDLAVVGAMLHDLGKLYTYKFDGVNIETTATGNLFDHIFIGAEFVGNYADANVDTDNPYVYGKVRLLRHIILSHHGQLEYGSPVTPRCIEAYIVHYADSIDATNEQIRVATAKTSEDSNWTEKLWTLNNCPHLTHRYVEKLLQ